MTIVLIGALIVASVVAARRFGLVRPANSPRDQVDAFTRARAVTNLWSADPQTTPAPLKEYLAGKQPQPQPQPQQDETDS